jgi:lysophospholipase-1
MEHVHSLINDEVSSGIPANRIVLGGFSQGGAVALLSGLTAPSKIGGIVGLSSWLLLLQTFREHIPAGNPNENTPILMGHGDEDPVVLYNLGDMSQKMLNTLGYSVTMKTYE